MKSILALFIYISVSLCVLSLSISSLKKETKRNQEILHEVCKIVEVHNEILNEIVDMTVRKHENKYGTSKNK